MATETRGLQFTCDPDNGAVSAETFAVPVTRTYIGAISGQNGPVLCVRGDWDVTESVDYSWVRTSTLPESGVTVATWGDRDYGFFGVCVEA